MVSFCFLTMLTESKLKTLYLRHINVCRDKSAPISPLYALRKVKSSQSVKLSGHHHCAPLLGYSVFTKKKLRPIQPSPELDHALSLPDRLHLCRLVSVQFQVQNDRLTPNFLRNNRIEYYHMD